MDIGRQPIANGGISFPGGLPLPTKHKISDRSSHAACPAALKRGIRLNLSKDLSFRI
jgi:hypothetical protein